MAATVPEYGRISIGADAPKVVTVVLNWNRLADTVECLKSLGSVDYSNHSVIVIDNASTEDPTPVLSKLFPQLKLIRARENLGYAGGNNLGIAEALSNGAEYIVLLNNDTVVDPRFVSEMVRAAEGNAKIGLLGPKVLTYDRQTTIWSLGGRVGWFYIRGGGTRHIGYGVSEDRLPDKLLMVDYVPGCAVMVRREIIERVGSFDPGFFCYYEDVDLAMRVREAGYHVVAVPQAKIWHKVGSTSGGGGSPLTVYYRTRNYMLLKRKHSANRLIWLALLLSRMVILLPAEAIFLITRDIIANRNLRYRVLTNILRAYAFGIKDFLVRTYGPCRYHFGD